MILSTHFVTGAAVANKVDNPLILLVLSLFLHFAMDIIPHWQYVYTMPGLKNRKVQMIILLDLLAGPLIIATLVGANDLSRLFWLYAGGIFCMLPDFFSVLSIIFPKNDIFKKILEFHDILQKKAHRYGKAEILGISTQLVIIILALWVLNF